jgi:ferredoxin-NADP reductase
VVVGDELEVRGPIGGWFVWDGDAPALLVGGGSGVVPLMAMLRLARRTGRADLVRLVVSVRTPGDLYYSDEIDGPETTLIYTRATPPSFPRLPGRLTRDDIPQPIAAGGRAYVCGSSGFADAASSVLLELGVPSQQIRVERFGPTA